MSLYQLANQGYNVFIVHYDNKYFMQQLIAY